MNPVFDTYTPEGFSTINTYLFVEQPTQLIQFLKNAFYAEEIQRSLNPDNGEISNCILKIGNTCFMISQALGQFRNMRTAIYLFVDNVDEMHKRALENGGKEEFEPENMDYQDRQSGIIDPSGNYWWISNRLVHKGYHE